MLQSQLIAKLEAQVATLEKDLATANQANAPLQAELVEAREAVTQAKSLEGIATAKVTELTEQLATANTDIAAATKRADEAEASVETKVEAEVINRLAAAGVDPIKRDPAAKTGDEGGKVETLTGIKAATAALAAKAAAKKG